MTNKTQEQIDKEWAAKVAAEEHYQFSALVTSDRILSEIEQIVEAECPGVRITRCEWGFRTYFSFDGEFNEEKSFVHIDWNYPHTQIKGLRQYDTKLNQIPLHGDDDETPVLYSSLHKAVGLQGFRITY